MGLPQKHASEMRTSSGVYLCQGVTLTHGLGHNPGSQGCLEKNEEVAWIVRGS